MRGCVASLEDGEKNYCAEYGDTCKTCFRNGCNNKTAFPECFVTNGVVLASYRPSAENDDKVSRKICKKYDDSCFTLTNNNNIVIRDCVNDYAERNQVSVNFLTQTPKKTSYEVCSEPLCNDHEIQQFSCLLCDSRYDGNCDNAALLDRQQCSLEVIPSGCYHFQGDHIEKGCITDLDKEKRELCESDSDVCKKCTGNECNSRQSFQECLVTDEENLTSTKTCKRYTDECFIHVLDNNIRRGCIGDLVDWPIDGIDIVEDCKNDEICEKCSDRDNCNNREVETENCIVCSSKGDIKYESYCTFYPEQLKNASQQCPLSLKPSGCYLWRELVDAERGCMSKLNTTMKKECRATNTSCKMCLGDKCNEKRGFQICTDCDSQSYGKACIDEAYVTTTRTCANYHGECYTQVQDGRVIRNCVGDEVVPDADTCKNHPESCQLCSGSRGCNDKNIKTLTCISCDSVLDPTCGKNTTFSQFMTCSLSIHEPSCYHLIDTNGLHRRGTFFYSYVCFRRFQFHTFEIQKDFNSKLLIILTKKFQFFRHYFHLGCTSQLSKSYQELCEANGNECKICTSDKCNKKTSFERCFHCDSRTDPFCLAELGEYQSTICTNYEDTCYTHVSKHHVERGCFEDQNYYFKSACSRNQNKCATCTTALGLGYYNGLGCNDQKIKMEYCAECDSQRDKNCRDKPELFKNKVCNQLQVFGSVAPKEGCYMLQVCT